MKQSSMDNWYKRVKNLSINTPDTYRVELDKAEEGIVDYDVDYISTAVNRLDGPPAFIRTDMPSDKHNMGETSKLHSNKEKVISAKVDRLIDHNLMIQVPFQNLYIREWLDIAHDFVAFNHMPVGYEVRYFIYDGEILNKHFYWPEEAIKFRGSTKEPDDWKDQLKKTKKNTLRLSKTLDNKLDALLQEFNEGFWSVDFAFTNKGEWYLIDMARGEVSWHPKKDQIESNTVPVEKYKKLY